MPQVVSVVVHPNFVSAGAIALARSRSSTPLQCRLSMAGVLRGGVAGNVAFSASADGNIEIGGAHFLRSPRRLRPGFSVALTLRPVAMSASDHRQSVRPPPIGTAIEGRINPSASQRLSVLNETRSSRRPAGCCTSFSSAPRFSSDPRGPSIPLPNVPRQSRTLFRHSLASRAKSGPLPFPPSACQTLSRYSAISPAIP